MKIREFRKLPTLVFLLPSHILPHTPAAARCHCPPPPRRHRRPHRTLLPSSPQRNQGSPRTLPPLHGPSRTMLHQPRWWLNRPDPSLLAPRRTMRPTTGPTRTTMTQSAISTASVRCLNRPEEPSTPPPEVRGGTPPSTPCSTDLSEMCMKCNQIFVKCV
jgi:hypothetical protein